MKSLKSGMKSRSSDWKMISKTLKNNCKIETIILIIWVIWISLLSTKFPTVKQKLCEYFSQGRCSAISGYTSIVIGIYATVWSMFAISAEKINEELLRNRVEDELYVLIALGIIEALTTTIVSIFINRNTGCYINIILLLSVITSISFIKFLIILLKITKENLRLKVKEIDEKNKKTIEIQCKIDEIYYHTVDNK